VYNLLNVDIHSLYRHEHIAPEKLIARLHRVMKEKQDAQRLDMFSANELFGNALEKDELEKVNDYYHHNGWTNRLIQDDSLLVMTGLLNETRRYGRACAMLLFRPAVKNKIQQQLADETQRPKHKEREAPLWTRLIYIISQILNHIKSEY